MNKELYKIFDNSHLIIQEDSSKFNTIFKENKIQKSTKIYPFNVADMNFPICKEIQLSLKKKIDEGLFGYSSTQPEYYEAIINWYLKNHNYIVEESEIYRLPGVKKGLKVCLTAFSKPKDKIIIFTPNYSNFFKIVEGNDRIIIECELIRRKNKYFIDYDLFEEKVKKNQPKILIFCSPHNPIGRVWLKEELETILTICSKYNVIFISDEIFMDLVYNENKHIVAGSTCFSQNIIIISGVVKSFNLAAIGGAFAIIKNKQMYKIFSDEALTYDYHNDYGSNMEAISLISAFQNGKFWLDCVKNYIYQNYLFTINFFEKYFPKIEISNMEGTYIIWGEFSSLNIKEDLFFQLCRELGYLFFSPGSAFKSKEKHFRMCIACSKTFLENGLNTFKEIFIDKISNPKL